MPSARAGSGRPSVSASATARSAAAIASSVCAGEELRRGELRVGGDERRAGRLLLEQVDGLGGERDLSALAQYVRDAGEQDQRPRFGLLLAAGAEGDERLVERGRGLARAAGLEGGVRPAERAALAARDRRPG